MNSNPSSQAGWRLAAIAGGLALLLGFVAITILPGTNSPAVGKAPGASSAGPVSPTPDRTAHRASTEPAGLSALVLFRRQRAQEIRAKIEVAIPFEDPTPVIPWFTELVHLDAPLAAELAARLAPGASRTSILQIVGGEWAALAPEPALVWAAQLDPADERQLVREYICQRIAQRDPSTALSLAAQAGLGPESSLAAELTQQWAARDAAAALQWALHQPAGAARDQLLSRVALVLAEKAPAQAGQLVVDEIAPGPERDESAISVLHQWALRDLPGAEQWVAQFPPGPLRTRAEHELAGVTGKPGQ